MNFQGELWFVVVASDTHLLHDSISIMLSYGKFGSENTHKRTQTHKSIRSLFLKIWVYLTQFYSKR